jgi:predicted nucleotidyltransferase
MISDSDKKSIISTARKYNVSRVLLFGSSLSDKKEASDIDLAVEGIEPADFFSFYGDLTSAFSLLPVFSCMPRRPIP